MTMPSTACRLCGHVAADHAEGFMGGEADGQPLCHVDDHSCYVSWTVQGERPVTDTVLPPTMRAVDDPRDKAATWTLMPIDISDGQCSQCAVIHEPDMPHDNQSLAYQYSFYAEHDRWPTWVDAMAHCTQDVREGWSAALRERGVDI
jgi:hypothetical protein